MTGLNGLDFAEYYGGRKVRFNGNVNLNALYNDFEYSVWGYTHDRKDVVILRVVSDEKPGCISCNWDQLLHYYPSAICTDDSILDNRQEFLKSFDVNKQTFVCALVEWLEVVEDNAPSEKIKLCTCTMQQLMRSGCKCGGK